MASNDSNSTRANSTPADPGAMPPRTNSAGKASDTDPESLHAEAVAAKERARRALMRRIRVATAGLASGSAGTTAAGRDAASRRALTDVNRSVSAGREPAGELDQAIDLLVDGV